MSTGLVHVLTFGGFFQVTFDKCNELGVLAEAGVMIRIVTQRINCLQVSAVLQQHLYCILAAELAAQNQSRPTRVQKHGSERGYNPTLKHNFSLMGITVKACEQEEKGEKKYFANITLS